MNGHRARAIRHEVYGDFSPRQRDYAYITIPIAHKRTKSELTAGELRRRYQRRKHADRPAP